MNWYTSFWLICRSVPLKNCAVTSGPTSSATVLWNIGIVNTSLVRLFGVLGSKATAKAYFNDTLALFLGSFVVALAVQKHRLHRRLALNTLALTGTRPSGVLLGCILAPFLLSMWRRRSGRGPSPPGSRTPGWAR